MTIANTTIQIKKSGTTGNKPTSLNYGELALNYYDGKLFYKDSLGNISYFYGANNGPSFATANANNNLILSTTPNDTLSFNAGSGISISACTTSKTITIADTGTYSLAINAYAQANAAFLQANSAYTRANNSVNANTGGTITGNINITGNLFVTGANVALGNVGNVHIYGGNTGQLLSTDNLGNLSFIDLPTPNTITYTANSLIQTNGVYVSGNLWSTQVFGDYAVTNGSYVLTDGSGSAPAWYITFDFINVVKFNRVVMNINYTQSSGHTIYIQLYNYATSTWDSIGTYTGLGSYYAFALDVIDETNYVSSGITQLKLYHSNAGNTGHQTNIDYIALEQSFQGPQGPRGPTGPTGAAGQGLVTGGTVGQVLVKNSSTDYDTSWSNNLINAYSQANAAYTQANAAFDAANTGSSPTFAFTQANAAFLQANSAYSSQNVTGTYANSAYGQANSAALYANGAFVQANAAFLKANTPDFIANSAALYANGAFGAANSASLYANASFIQANAAFNAANTKTPRVITITDATSVTMNADTTDIAVQTNTQSVGTLTINAITGTLNNGQKIIFRLKSSSIQTFSWDTVFSGSSDLSLPSASTGSNKYDYMGFIYNSDASPPKWQIIAKNFGF